MKSFLQFIFIASAALTISCQSNTSNDQIEEVENSVNASKEKEHDVNKWHDGPVYFETASGRSLHDAGAFQGALANCNTYGHYEGDGETLAVYEKDQSYHGEIDVEVVEINKQLNVCGSLNVNDELVVNKGGTLNMGGDLLVQGDLVINHGGHMVIEGNVFIEGNLILKNDAIVRFLGEKNSIEVLGKAKISKKSNIEGQFKDISRIF